MKSIVKRQGKLRLDSPAKITPWLHILDRRRDGYHDVDSCLVPVSWFDTLLFRAGKAGPIKFRVHGGEGLGALENNLVLRAAQAFEEALGRELPVEIDLTKRIPWGAGLGGGSGNAAATLLALNRMLGEPVPTERIFDLALKLGSDVPFFLDPRPRRAQGRGEKLSGLLDFPAVELILVKPALSIPTHQAYARVDSYRGAVSVREPHSFEELAAILENDFESVLFPQYPELREIKQRLLSAGAAAAALSGSGSALFGLFRNEAERDRALQRFQVEPEWEVHACATLSRYEYFPSDS
jgi:4-diphosphocytidyl-2-C-methyl-D-erythritol kinase